MLQINLSCVNSYYNHTTPICQDTNFGDFLKLSKKFNFVNKNKNDKQLKKDFETWKKLAKGKMTKLKHNELTEEEVYKWLETHK